MTTKKQLDSKIDPQRDAVAGGVPPAIFFWLAMLLVVAGMLAVYGAYRMRPTTPGGQAVYETPKIPKGELVTAFSLQERSGKVVGSDDLKGKVWVANFFFSTCPGSCRQQTTLVSELQRKYHEDVQFVSITCDPKQDTAEVLREYAHQFNAPDDWWFLTGEMLYLRRVGAEFFQLAVDEKGHQDRLAVVDKWGNVRGRFNWHDEFQMEKLRKMLEQLPAEQSPPGGEEAMADDDGSEATDSKEAAADQESIGKEADKDD
ncbi:MAG: SCO family protein [Planctomycetales bacterium]|nr:SCO family protein [Planctomycetales bacterium]